MATKAIALAPQNGWYYLRRADALEKQGNQPAAARDRKKAEDLAKALDQKK